VDDERDVEVALRAAYERVALTGAKSLDTAPGATASDRELREALTRLERAGLAEVVGGAFSLNRPDDALIELDPATRDLLRVLYDYWLRRDDDERGDEVLDGELGFWRHMWNALHAHPDRASHPLELEMVVPDDGDFATRDWLAELDRELLDPVAEARLLTGRVIVPPATLGSPAESIIGLLLTLGIEVRVLPSPSKFAIYDGDSAVLRDDPSGASIERHRLTRRAAVVEPLRRLFELQWAAGIPWGEYVKGAAGILQLLAQGWTDARIAGAMGVSTRTVSRRVSEVMAAAGVQSRFELGMRYALQQLGALD